MPAPKEASHLLEFYGTECAHCVEMEPLLKKLEKEEGIKPKRYEVWHNAQNAALYEQKEQGLCGGVPFFLNEKTGKFICGSATYEELKAWAKGN